jgi:hypothetical protein
VSGRVKQGYVKEAGLRLGEVTYVGLRYGTLRYAVCAYVCL